ncbi:MAG: acetate--CoA ligase family protein [Candidatus Marsarchaeota archaeon]|nr:acetate--CoA ligase family protein [Candidatus Marsarchaeota archaeon]MCL5115191.1 acetate--CoA ligase family protein [Candidatus Marsarchaeota archaeon]
MLVDYYTARKTLQKYKIKSVESRYVSSADDAIEFWNQKGMIVMKALSDKALHKSKSGLVELYLARDKQIKEAYSRLTRKAKSLKIKGYKIIAQRMINNGKEIIIGGNIDQQFGKMILLGLGGVYVETFKDFALRVCPITRRDALSMLNQLKSRSVIAPDKKSESMIVDLLLKASKMFSSNNMSEMDLNPIILHDGTYDAVDLRMLR